MEVCEIDSEVLLHQIDRRLIDELRRAGPFGEGNPAPLFAACDVEQVVEARRVGADGNHLYLKLRGAAGSIPAIGFGLGARCDEARAARLDLLFTPRASTLRGGGPELLLKDLRPRRAPASVEGSDRR